MIVEHNGMSFKCWAIISQHGGFKFPLATHNEEYCWSTFVESWMADFRRDRPDYQKRFSGLSDELREMGYRTVLVRVEQIGNDNGP